MHSYMIGKVIYVNDNRLTFENNHIGYYINVKNEEGFEPGNIQRLYIYKKTNKDFCEELYGFNNWEEKKTFLEFITVPGIGPKTALSILSKSEINILKSAIATDDSQALISLGVSQRNAKNLCVELMDKYKELATIGTKKMGDLIDALKVLGYTKTQINIAIRTIDDYSIELENLVSEAIEKINILYNA